MNILVVEDDELVAEFIKRALKQQNHYAVSVGDGLEGFKKAQSAEFDAIILDVVLPMKDGLSICRDLRRLKVSTPILILSAQVDEDSRIAGLDAGADDYLVKPFSYRELHARLRAITRRPSSVVQSRLKAGNLALDPDSREVTRNGLRIELRPKEYELLEYMMRNPNTAIPKRVLLSRVWGINSDATSNRLEVYIRHLRGKIGDESKKGLITTVRNVGYKLAVE